MAGAILAPERAAAEAPVFGATPANAVEVMVTNAIIDAIATNFIAAFLPCIQISRPAAA